MTDHVPPPSAPAGAKSERQARLAEQLRANLHRRKAQSRALAAGEAAGEADKTDLSKP